MYEKRLWIAKNGDTVVEISCPRCKFKFKAINPRSTFRKRFICQKCNYHDSDPKIINPKRK